MGPRGAWAAAHGRDVSSLRCTIGGGCVVFGSGIALVLTGVFNLLNVRYAQTAAGLRWCCIVTNVAMSVFATIAGVVTHASMPEFIVILGLIGGATVLSVLRGAVAIPESGA